MKKVCVLLVLLATLSGVVAQAPRPPVDKLSRLTDVNITSAADAQVLTYDNASSKWKNALNAGGALTLTGDTTGTKVGSSVATTTSNMTAPASFTLSDSGTNAVHTLATYKYDSTGTPGIGFGMKNIFELETTTTNDQIAAVQIYQWSTAANATRTSQYTLQLVNNAVAGDVLVISGNGNAAFTGAVTGSNLNITNWNTAFTQTRQWDGGSTGLTAATGRTSLGGTTVGQSFFTLTNPTAITFLRINADNSVSALDAATFRTAIGAGTGGGDALTTNPLSQFAATTSSQFKGVISDENAPDGASSKVIMALGSLSIASGKTATFSNTLTLAGTDSSTLNIGAGGTLGSNAYTSTAYVPTSTTVNGHALSSNVTVTPTDLSLVIGTNTEAWDADLDTWATLTPSANFQTMSAHTFSQMRTDLSLVIGTNTQAWDADLDTLAGLTATTDNFIVSVASSWASRTPTQVKSTLGLVIGTNVEAWDADLDTWATLTPSANFQTMVPHTFSQMRTDLSLVVGTNVEAWDADLDTWATLTPSANFQTMAPHTFSQMRSDLGLVIGTNVEAWDADLDTWAGVTPGTGVATALAVNVGSAGAFVTFNGAGGTPSSMTGTNLSGTGANFTAGNATKWTTGRTIATTGDVTYTSGSLDGSGNVTGTATVANVPVAATHATDNTTLPTDTGGWTEYFITTTDFTTTNLTATDITGLVTGTLSASTRYEFEVNLVLLNGADSNGMKLAIHGAGTGTAATVHSIYSANTSAVGTGAGFSLNQIDTLGSAIVTYSTGEGSVKGGGFFNSTSTGTPTMSVQIAKVTGNTATVRVGSVLRIRKAHT